MFKSLFRLMHGQLHVGAGRVDDRSAMALIDHQARVAARHVRRDGLDHLKKLEKDGHVGKDEIERLSEQVQKATDEALAEIDAALAAKEKEIMHV